MLAVQLYGPFLRSMVKCTTKMQPGLFTGSAHCGDANLVPFLHNFRSQDLGKDIGLCIGTRIPDQCLIHHKMYRHHAECVHVVCSVHVDSVTSTVPTGFRLLVEIDRRLSILKSVLWHVCRSQLFKRCFCFFSHIPPLWKRQVLSVAQAREGRLVAMKLLVHAFAGPVLALLADSIGRRPVLLLGAWCDQHVPRLKVVWTWSKGSIHDKTENRSIPLHVKKMKRDKTCKGYVVSSSFL